MATGPEVIWQPARLITRTALGEADAGVSCQADRAPTCYGFPGNRSSGARVNVTPGKARRRRGLRGSGGRESSSEVGVVSRHGAFPVLALAGLLILAACGLGKPASHGAVRVASVIHIGPYTQVFASPLPANTAQAGVVEGFREGQVLWEKSENVGHLVPPVRDYVTGQALTHLAAAMKAGKTRDLIPAGMDRFFQTRVAALTGRSATVATCDDGSKFKEVNPRTGKVGAGFPPTPGQAYLFETWRMGRHGGHWAITGFSVASLPSRSAEPCQPGMTGPGPSRRPNVAGLLRQMSRALRAARSVHITGAIQQNSKTVGLNLGLTRSGELYGQVTEDGAVLTLLSLHGHTYLKLSRAFLRVAHLPATACRLFCGKYLQYPAAQSHLLVGHLNMASMTHYLTSTPDDQVTLLGAVSVGGQPAWLLQDSHDNSIYVAAHGEPYVLREVSAPPGEDSLNLTQWNAARIPGPPPANQIVRPSQLTR